MYVIETAKNIQPHRIIIHRRREQTELVHESFDNSQMYSGHKINNTEDRGTHHTQTNIRDSRHRNSGG
jgi:hypothetical protein